MNAGSRLSKALLNVNLASTWHHNQEDPKICHGHIAARFGSGLAQAGFDCPVHAHFLKPVQRGVAGVP